MNLHVASGSHEVENQHHEDFNETVIPNHSVNAGRHFFPMEQSRSSEQNVLHDRLPDLELALGAKRKQKTRAMQPVMVGKQERKMSQYILDVAALKEEDDVPLSLSLSYRLATEE